MAQFWFAVLRMVHRRQKRLRAAWAKGMALDAAIERRANRHWLAALKRAPDA
jgi:hypothetical protein